MPQRPVIAMWSGPRNLSTAMMRSFGNRKDCSATDEPFYAAYLATTGLDHPMRDDIIADGETDPDKIVEQCLSAPPSGSAISYQKHMCHHMIDGFDTSWIGQVHNVFLLRDPARVLASYANKTTHVEASDIGFLQQEKLFERATGEFGQKQIVVDSHDIGANPSGMLKALCAALNIPFSADMLTWQAGEKPEDGIWARHWYDAVWNSTGFSPPDLSNPPILKGRLAEVEAEVRPSYVRLSQFKMMPIEDTPN